MGLVKSISRFNKTLNWSRVDKFSVRKPIMFPLLIGIFCTLITYVFFFPDYQNINEKTYHRVDVQISAPFEKVDYPAQNHWAKRQLRLTVPLIAHIIGLNGKSIFYLQQFLLIVFFVIAYKLSFSILKDVLNSILLTTGFVFIYISKSFLQVEPLYDAFAYLFIIIPLLWKHPIVLFSSLLAACFVDERAAIASIGVFLYIFFQDTHKFDFKKTVTPSLLTYIMLPFFVLGLRYYLYITYGLATPIGEGTGVVTSTFFKNFNLMPISFLSMYEGFWLIILIGIYTIIRNGEYFKFTAYGIYLLFILISSYMVVDITRSLAYGFPLAFICLRDIVKDKSVLDMRKIILRASTISFLIPTYYMWGGDMNVVYWMSPMIPKIFRILL